MEREKKATRAGFGEEIVELGKKDNGIYVVDADIGKSCKTTKFAQTLPKQHLNVGIAEQNAAGVAAGLATTGKTPFVVTYAVFGSLRMCEMIRQEICYPNLNVKIACSHGGVTPANDGASHQAIEDMGVLRTIPNMTVIMPADYWSARKLVAAAANTYGPMFLRFTRDAIPSSMMRIRNSRSARHISCVTARMSPSSPTAIRSASHSKPQRSSRNRAFR